MTWGLWGIGVPGPGERIAQRTAGLDEDDDYDFGNWWEDENQLEPHRPFSVDLTDLVAQHDWMNKVMQSGETSKTPGEPIQVSPRSDMPGAFEINDGHHRVAEAIRRGDRSITAVSEPWPKDDYHPPFFDFYQYSNRHAHRTASYGFQKGETPYAGGHRAEAFDPDTGETVGYLEHDRDSGEVSSIWVHPDHRGRGIATDLFDWTRSYVNSRLRHSDDLTDEGRAWAESMGHDTGNARTVQWPTAHRTAMPAIDAYDDEPEFDDHYNPIPGTEKFPEEIRRDDHEIPDGPFYHATEHEFSPGDIVQSHSALHGHQGDRGNHADWVWMGRDPSVALSHAGPHLYEVEPLDEGPWEWNYDIFSSPGGKAGRYVSPRARVVRKVEHNDPRWSNYKKARIMTAAVTAARDLDGIEFGLTPGEHGGSTPQPHDRHMETAAVDTASGRQVGWLSRRPTGEIYEVSVHPDYRRRGIATALFDWTKANVDPELHHSTDMTDEGAAWAATMGWTPDHYNEKQMPAVFHPIEQMPIHEGPTYRHAHRTAMPAQDAYDDFIPHFLRKRETPPAQGEFFHGSDQEYRPGDILESARARGDQHRIDYFENQVGSPSQADWVWMHKHPDHVRDYGKNVYQVEPLDEGPWPWGGPRVDSWDGRPLRDDEPDDPDQKPKRYVSPRARVIRKLNNRKARTMTAAVTVYTQPNCVQCTMTKKQLDKLGIAHDTVDVSADPEAHAYVTGLGYTAAPVVVVNNGESHWAGFRPERLKELVGGE